MATGSAGAAGSGAGGQNSAGQPGTASTVGSLGPKLGQKGARLAQQTAPPRQPMTGQGAQFIYAAATVANILCDNLTQQQINLLANFLSVVTTSVYAVLAVENPNEIIEG